MSCIRLALIHMNIKTWNCNRILNNRNDNTGALININTKIHNTNTHNNTITNTNTNTSVNKHIIGSHFLFYTLPLDRRRRTLVYPHRPRALARVQTFRHVTATGEMQRAGIDTGAGRAERAPPSSKSPPFASNKSSQRRGRSLPAGGVLVGRRRQEPRHGTWAAAQAVSDGR